MQRVVDKLDEAHMRTILGQGDYSAEDVVEMLTRLGENLCQYGGGDWRTRRCDCKFIGADRKMVGEASGCAEVRMAVEMIERLSGTGKAQDNAALRSKVRSVRALAYRHLQEMEEATRLP